MYVTKPLSHYLEFPESLSLVAEGPNSGILVLQDKESENTCCFGFCKERDLPNLPFPQNKSLTIRYSSGGGEDRHVSYDDVALIPALNQPLSSNRYYAIKPHGRHKGEAYVCSKDEDKATCCFCRCVQDVKPRPLDPHDMYQQFEIAPYETICNHGGSFYAKSVAPDGYPPSFLRRKGWQIYTKTPKNYELGEAPGLDAALRARLPEFNFPPSYKSSEAVTVGKWYCPFMFIKEWTLGDQMKRSMYYEMTLEQAWEQIFACENSHSPGNNVTIDVSVKSELVLVANREALWDERYVVDGTVWFTGVGSTGEEARVGLNLAVVDRMKWEQQRVGWVSGKERQVRVKRVEDYGGIGGWTRFGCYVLAERFVLKRNDGSVVMTYCFRHTHRIGSRWE